MTMRVSDGQSESNLNSSCKSCDVFLPLVGATNCETISLIFAKHRCCLAFDSQLRNNPSSQQSTSCSYRRYSSGSTKMLAYFQTQFRAMEDEDENQYQYFSKCVGGEDGGWKLRGHTMLLLLTTSLNELSPIKTNGQRIKGRTDRRMERHIWKTASHCPS